MKKIIILSSLFLLIEGITALMLVYNHEEDIYIFANVDALASEESSCALPPKIEHLIAIEN